MIIIICIILHDQNFLHAELWLQWIGDELPLCSIPEAALEMRELFETAVKDYLCKYI